MPAEHCEVSELIEAMESTEPSAQSAEPCIIVDERKNSLDYTEHQKVNGQMDPAVQIVDHYSMNGEHAEESKPFVHYNGLSGGFEQCINTPCEDYPVLHMHTNQYKSPELSKSFEECSQHCECFDFSKSSEHYANDCLTSGFSQHCEHFTECFQSSEQCKSSDQHCKSFESSEPAENSEFLEQCKISDFIPDISESNESKISFEHYTGICEYSEKYNHIDDPTEYNETTKPIDEDLKPSEPSFQQIEICGLFDSEFCIILEPIQSSDLNMPAAHDSPNESRHVSEVHEPSEQTLLAEQSNHQSADYDMPSGHCELRNTVYEQRETSVQCELSERFNSCESYPCQHKSTGDKCYEPSSSFYYEEDKSSECSSIETRSFESLIYDSINSGPLTDSAESYEALVEEGAQDKSSSDIWESFDNCAVVVECEESYADEDKPHSDAVVVEEFFDLFDKEDTYTFSQRRPYTSCFEGGGVHELFFEQRKTHVSIMNEEETQMPCAKKGLEVFSQEVEEVDGSYDACAEDGQFNVDCAEDGQLNVDYCAEDGQLNVDCAEDGQLNVDCAEDGLFNVDCAEDGQLNVDCAEDGQLNVDCAEDGLFNVDCAEDGLFNVDCAEDGQLNVDCAEDGLFNVDCAEDGQLNVDCAEDGQLNVDCAEDGLFNIDCAEDGQLNVDCAEDGQLNVDCAEDGQLNVDCAEDGQLNVDCAEDGQLNVDCAEDGQLNVDCAEDGQLNVDCAEDGQLNVDCAEDGQLNVDCAEDGQPNVDCAEDGQLNVDCAEDGLFNVDCAEDETSASGSFADEESCKSCSEGASAYEVEFYDAFVAGDNAIEAEAYEPFVEEEELCVAENEAGDARANGPLVDEDNKYDEHRAEEASHGSSSDVSSVEDDEAYDGQNDQTYEPCFEEEKTCDEEYQTICIAEDELYRQYAEDKVYGSYGPCDEDFDAYGSQHTQFSTEGEDNALCTEACEPSAEEHHEYQSEADESNVNQEVNGFCTEEDSHDQCNEEIDYDSTPETHFKDGVCTEEGKNDAPCAEENESPESFEVITKDTALCTEGSKPAMPDGIEFNGDQTDSSTTSSEEIDEQNKSSEICEQLNTLYLSQNWEEHNGVSEHLQRPESEDLSEQVSEKTSLPLDGAEHSKDSIDREPLAHHAEPTEPSEQSELDEKMQLHEFFKIVASEQLSEESEEELSDDESFESCECEYCVLPREQVPAKPLLPQLKSQDSGKICVVIDLDETLVHSSFKPVNNADFIIPVEIDGTVHQVYVLKRPNVDEYLKRMGELFECVLFTASLSKYADPVSDLLDKWGAFQHRLFRESCVFHQGNYVKDLSRLGRDLNKVIIVDNSPASYIFHPDNAVPVTSWFDDMADTELLDLIPFFERLSKVEDVYDILKQQRTAS
ncbi:uncharacterized protein ACWYII_013036 isoform 3-T4 [Salvelinus alpinus]